MNLNEKVQNGLRSYLRNLAKRRSNRIVTADDAHTFLNGRGIRQNQSLVRLAYVNSTLRSPEFVTVGETASSRPAARSRRISTWTMATV